MWSEISWFTDMHAHTRDRQGGCFELQKQKTNCQGISSTCVIMMRDGYVGEKHTLSSCTRWIEKEGMAGTSSVNT